MDPTAGVSHLHVLLLRRMDAIEAPVPSLLLALPDACLLAVLQCCAADDQRSLFCAARAHSRLHQVAVLAQRNITAFITQQQHVDSVLLYLHNHGQHVDTIDLKTGLASAAKFKLRQLPPSMQLDKLCLDNMCWGPLQA
jgi:hypothetical protein